MTFQTPSHFTYGNGGVTVTLDYLDDSKAWVTNKSWDGDGDVTNYHNALVLHKDGYQVRAYDPMVEGYEANGTTACPDGIKGLPGIGEGVGNGTVSGKT